MADLFIPATNTGFFSACSLQLERIAQYFNKYKRCPDSVDRSKQFDWYKPADVSIEEYFENSQNLIRYREWIHFEHYYQFLNYKTINMKPLQPFITKFFAPSLTIRKIVEDLEKKYRLDHKKTFTLFYRGNDKATETALAPYDKFIERAKEFQKENPEFRCLVQTDETEFLELALKEIPNSFYFADEIRHMPKKRETTVDKVFKEENFIFSKFFLAIILIMSQTQKIICGTGNCSLWIALYRGSADGIEQFLNLNFV